MRVLHLNSLLTGGGTDDQCVRLVQGLRRLGVEAHLAGPEGRVFGTVARELGVPLLVTPPEGPLKLRFILAAARLLRRERIQIVHAHHGRDLWPTLLAAKLSGMNPKIVFTRHMAKSPSSWPSRRFLLGQCDALIAVSEFTARVLCEGVYEPGSPEPERRARPPLRGDHAKIRVIHGGVDTERFRPLPRTEPRVAALRRAWGLGETDFAFGVVGGFDLPRGKGQREFLAAAAAFRALAPRARFLLIGQGSMEPLLRADIERLGLDGCARLTGQCADMPAAMNALDCLVHPQVGTEAFGLVVCEAHACGVPVIASALDGIPEAFAAGGSGALVPPEDVPALTARMASQVALPPAGDAERQAMHERVRAAFSLAVQAESVCHCYRDLLQSTP